MHQLDSEISETKKLIEAAELAEKILEGKITLPQVLSPILQKHRNKDFLLVIDQFEELYTLCQDILQVDNGLFHKAKRLQVPENIRLLA